MYIITIIKISIMKIEVLILTVMKIMNKGKRRQERRISQRLEVVIQVH